MNDAFIKLMMAPNDDKMSLRERNCDEREI